MYKLQKSSDGVHVIPMEADLLSKRKIFIRGEIADGTATDFFQEMLLLNSESSEPIDLFINSPGGCVSAGLSIIDCMKLSPAPVRTICIDQACSTAALIFAAGKTRLMFPQSQLMIHEPSPSTPLAGNVTSLEKHMEELNRVWSQITKLLLAFTNADPEEIRRMTKEDTYFGAEEAIRLRFADGIVDSSIFGKGAAVL